MTVPRFVTVTCCYCGLRQPAAEPPNLVTCGACKRDFRVIRNRSGLRPIEISNEAKARLSKPRGAA